MAKVALVVPADGVERFTDALPPDAGGRVLVVGGGEERTHSVVAGITALTVAGVTEETPVLVHDAARPRPRRSSWCASFPRSALARGPCR